jgi:hypothetical protein
MYAIESTISQIERTELRALLPLGAPDYQNRRIYTPISAVMHHALGDKCPQFKRPKGATREWEAVIC